MTDADIQLDGLEEAPAAKPKGGTPVWMVAMVILAFVFFATTLALQFMEFRYHRGGAISETDPYAGEVLLRPAS